MYFQAITAGSGWKPRPVDNSLCRMSPVLTGRHGCRFDGEAEGVRGDGTVSARAPNRAERRCHVRVHACEDVRARPVACVSLFQIAARAHRNRARRFGTPSATSPTVPLLDTTH